MGSWADATRGLAGARRTEPFICCVSHQTGCTWVPKKLATLCVRACLAQKANIFQRVGPTHTARYVHKHQPIVYFVDLGPTIWAGALEVARRRPRYKS